MHCVKFNEANTVQVCFDPYSSYSSSSRLLYFILAGALLGVHSGMHPGGKKKNNNISQCHCDKLNSGYDPFYLSHFIAHLESINYIQNDFAVNIVTQINQVLLESLIIPTLLSSATEVQIEK